MSRRIPSDFFKEEVLPHLTVEMVYPGVSFKQQGHYRRGPCPIHQGEYANFSVHEGHLGYTCFSKCGSGSVYAALNHWVEPRGRDFIETIRRAANLAGVNASELDGELSPDEQARDDAEHRENLLFEAFRHRTHELLEAEQPQTPGEYPGQRQKALTYLKGRGWSAEQIEASDFGLYTTENDVESFLKGKQFTDEEITRSGLLIDSRWRGRLVHPWRDRWGTIKTFWARDVSGQAEEGEKYLYRQGTNKAELVAFGLDMALKHQGPEGLIIVEGLFDVLSLHAHEILNVAGIGGNGKELSAERLQTLTSSMGVKKIVLLLDNDPAGREGTLAVVDKVVNVNNVPDVSVVAPESLGSVKDPDEFVRQHGAAAFPALLNAREPAVLYRGRALLEAITPESPEIPKRQAVEDMARFVGGLRGRWSVRDTDQLKALAATATGFSPEAIKVLFEETLAEEQRKAKKDELRKALSQAQAALNKTDDVGETLKSLTSSLAPLSVQSLAPPPPFSVERLDRESHQLSAGRSSGWSTLDALDVQFNPGEYAVIGARTGHGKTSFLVGLLLNWLQLAEKEKTCVVLYSAEEPEVRIYHRLLALLADGEWTVNEVRDFLRDPRSRGEDYRWQGRDLDNPKATLRTWEDRLLVVHRPAWNVEDLAAHARTVASSRPVGAVLVDYLQRVPAPPGRYDRRDIEISLVGRAFKTLAVDLSVPVVAGAQLSREAISSKLASLREKKGATHEQILTTIRTARPELQHLREGGSEQEADLILGLLNYAADYRDAGELSNTPEDLDIGVLKNRYGATGKWETLKFHGRSQRIQDKGISDGQR